MTMRPKIELHLHLEGAAPPKLIQRMAAEQGVRLDGVFDADGSYKYNDFTGFLNVYEAATQVLRTPEDFGRLTYAVLQQSAAQGVIYTEAFLSPDFCGGRDLGAWRDYLAAIQEAAASVPDIHMRGIVTCIRHFGPEAAQEVAECAAATAGDFITGFGMGGNEAVGTQGDFARAFARAKAAGLHLTTHAGEFGGPESVRSALDDLGVTRIGHGVRAIEDDALVDRLAAEGIVLEVCPGSNVALGLFERIEDHPIDRLHARGVPITVSTDDPPFFHTTMGGEYAALTKAFGWRSETWLDINRTAARAAFCDDATRNDLLTRLETSWTT
ncbi:adenosine deaminase [Jannaschia pagri]|uniref:Adenosine deaminase n=1 Tax=Jannaschia pagri TaxID=2829797 RepID=A0ABQ4NPR1_9RHOB|nr:MULTISPECIES: adenosine deaminase [unclassified Jannaschia]GIT92496.1 adenosine deaminase [Jannaschia sp. AI_61]GIT96331.1 adenosine deaminase [Jannaschia sp. AI_62]